MELTEELTIEGGCFCFTGGLEEMTRSEAEKEIKSRGGFISSKISNEVDFLVVGSKKNPAWRFGDYGNKLDAAMKLRTRTSKPRIIYEYDFLDALSLQLPIYDEQQPRNLLKISYKFIESNEQRAHLEKAFDILSSKTGLVFYQQEWHYNEYVIFDADVEDIVVQDQAVVCNFSLIGIFFQGAELNTLDEYIKGELSQFTSRPEKLKSNIFPEGTSRFVRYHRLMSSSPEQEIR